MNRRERQIAIDQAYADCGAEEYAARMMAMFAIELAGKQVEREVRPYREAYEHHVHTAEFHRRQAEWNARLKLRAKLEELGVIQGG